MPVFKFLMNLLLNRNVHDWINLTSDKWINPTNPHINSPSEVTVYLHKSAFEVGFKHLPVSVTAAIEGGFLSNS